MWRRALIASFMSAVAFACPRAADADDRQPAAAQSLFDAARDLMEKHQYAEACPKLEEANRLDPSAGTLLNLGRCYELSGRTASAWAAYLRAASVGRASGRARHVAAAEEAASALEPKLVKLAIDADAWAPDEHVTRGDVDIGKASLGVELAIDPDHYEIVATAPGHARWSTTIDATQPGAHLRVKIPALEVDPSAHANVAGPVAGTTTAPVPTAPAEETDPTPFVVSGALIGGTGVVLLGLGIGFGVMTMSAADDALNDPKLCPDYHCTKDGEAAIDDASTMSTVADVSIGIGAAATVAGAILLGIGISEAMDDPPAVAVWVDGSGAGAMIGGRF